MKKRRLLLVFLCVICAHGAMFAGNSYYVAGTIANGNGSGDSWTNAAAVANGPALYTIINTAAEGDAIYVGPGNLQPRLKYLCFFSEEGS